MFVFKRGRFTTQERATFDYFIKHFKDIKDISALVMTGYQSLNDDARKREIEEFKLSSFTSSVAAFG